MHVPLIAPLQCFARIRCGKWKLKEMYHLKVSSKFSERFSIHNESNLE